jgi:pyruvate kinase
MLWRLVEAGMDVARLNLSHGGRDDLERRLRRLVEVRAGLRDRALGILVDTRGPEIRIDAFPTGSVVLEPGQLFTLYPSPRAGDTHGVGVNYPRLAAVVRPGQAVLLDDGNLTLRVEDVVGEAVRCRVECGGELASGKKVSLPGVDLGLPPLHPDDVEDLRLAAAYQADFVAASFINSGEDVLTVRRVLEEVGGGHMAVIAKIETQQGVAHAEEILHASDGLMVARGDLGVELPAEEVPLVQKDLISRCLEAGKPVITATQMLESMVSKARPTRAEASDVANAIFDGSDAIMLSAETAVGRYPVEAVRTMARIAERTEQALPFRERLARRATLSATTITDAISYATAMAAQNLGAAAILSVTETGFTARMVAKYRPHNRILAATAERRVVDQLSVVWGVQPLLVEKRGSIDETIEASLEAARRVGAIQDGDLVVITAGTPAGLHGTTNMLKVLTVGEVVLRGTGVGRGAATGRVVVARGPDDASRFRDGDVLVVATAVADLVPLMARAGAIVSEEAGHSAAAAVALATGIPVILGARHATSLLRDGEVVTIDGARGLCYRGAARVL